MAFSLKLSPFDKVEILHVPRIGEEPRIKMSLAEFRFNLMSDVFGAQQYPFRGLLDLTGLGAKFQQLITIPKGSIIDFVGLQIGETVVAGGTSVKLGLGQHGSTPSAQGLTDDLVKGTFFSTMVAPTVLTADLIIDLCAVTTAGDALGDSNITAGKVLVSIDFRRPTTFFVAP